MGLSNEKASSFFLGIELHKEVKPDNCHHLPTIGVDEDKTHIIEGKTRESPSSKDTRT